MTNTKSRTPVADAETPKQSSDSTTLDSAGLHGELHVALNANSDAESILAQYREIVKRYTSAVGVGHIQRNHAGEWELQKNRATGRLPRRADFVEKFSSACDTTVGRNTIQIEHFLGLQAIYVPVFAGAGRTDVLLVLTDAKHAPHALPVLEIASAYLSQYVNSKDQHRNDWKLGSLAALIELVSEIEHQFDLDSACDVVTNELVRHLGAHQVAVGLVTRGQVKVRSLSGTIELDPASEEYRDIEIALNESLIRNEMGMFPTRRNGDSHLLLAHRQLCARLGVEGVVSSPLRTPSGEVVGAMLLTGPVELLHGDRLPNFINASAPRIAGALEVVSRAQRTGLRKLTHWLVTDARSMRAFSWYMLAMMIFSIMLIPVQYRVRCGCETQPVGRRFAVAPFAGIVDEGFVQAGDIVEQGQVLARLNATEIRWELAGVLAELEQASKQREIELSARNVTESMLAGIEKKRLGARAKLLEHRLNAVEICSPVSGIVLTGCLDRSNGAAVEIGEVIYEIAPPNALSLDVKVPASEIPRVEVGQPIQIWIDGITDRSFRSTVSRIRPTSELRDAKNVYVAEVVMQEQDPRLRPGMKGTVRINCDSNPLFWNLFHRPWEWAISRLTWW